MFLDHNQQGVKNAYIVMNSPPLLYRGVCHSVTYIRLSFSFQFMIVRTEGWTGPFGLKDFLKVAMKKEHFISAPCKSLRDIFARHNCEANSV